MILSARGRGNRREVLPVRLFAPGACLVFLALLAGCAGNVEYGDAGAVETVTVDFGSTDLQLIAEKMVGSLLASPTLQGGEPPVLQMSRFRNKTDEHIDTKAITDKIRTALVQSGKVRFTAAEVRDEIVDELEYQQKSGYVSEETRKRIGNMIGADYLLTGEMTSIRKRSGRKTDLYFLVTLNLVDLRTALIAWSEQKEIRKEATRPLLGW